MDDRGEVAPDNQGLPEFRGLLRERVIGQLSRVFDCKTALVVAPAGWGKTTSIAQMAVQSLRQVAWCRLLESDSSEQAVLERIWTAANRARQRGGAAGMRSWASFEDALEEVSLPEASQYLLVLDDFHHLRGTPAGALVARLVEDPGRRAPVVIASREEPEMNLSRMRVEGRLVELTADDLRFRTWEVERLFRDHYGYRLTPEESADLARRTAGWAACIELFRIATTGKPPATRSRVMASIQGRSRLIREYLARNVLDELPADLRHFLLQASVLAEPTASMCDELLGRHDSSSMLESLRARQLVMEDPVEDGAFAIHDVLRAELDAELVRTFGERAARQAHARAGALLEEHGRATAALQAYLRAGELDDARRVLEEHGQDISAAPGRWIDQLPKNLAASNPWVMLTRARLLARAGSLELARSSYRDAEEGFELGGNSISLERCRLERRILESWIDPDPLPAANPISLVRAALHSDPLRAAYLAKGMKGPLASLARGIAFCLAGEATPRGANELQQALTDPSCPQEIALGLTCVGTTLKEAGLPDLGLSAGAGAAEGLLADLEHLAQPWLHRVLTAFHALVAEATGPNTDELLAFCEADEDAWGMALVLMMDGARLARTATRLEDAAASLAKAASRFSELHASTLASICHAMRALVLVRSGSEEAVAALAKAATAARRNKSPLALEIATEAKRLLEEGPSQSSVAPRDGRSDAHGAAHGTSSSPSVPASAAVTMAASTREAHLSTPSQLEVRSLGGLSVIAEGRLLPLDEVKPKARKLLAYMVTFAPNLLHREQLVEAFWPEVPLSSGLRNLQVAISSLRGLLPDGEPGGGALIQRNGDAYGLVPADAIWLDRLAFEQEAESAIAVERSGDHRGARECFREAMSLYRGELLPEVGPEDWIVEPRERLRLLAARCALGLAEASLAIDDPRQALEACERGIAIDRFNDTLWRTYAAAHRKDGNEAMALTVESRYRQVLSELGVV